MLSKREKLFAAVSDLHGLICPVCRQLLSRQGDNLICAGGHAINVNRRGCVNLLSAQADTFYDAALFAARERVFAAGCYQPVADAIDALLPDAPQKLLDAGCGEGWYLNALLTRRTDSIGAGIDITQPDGRMIIDIGGGTTDIAVLSLGGKVKATSVRVAGNHYDEEILKFVRNKFSIAIGQRTAEELKKNVACCPQKADFNETMEVKGRSLLTGLPIRVNVSTSDLYEPVMMLSEQIGTAAHQVLEKTPPELAGDIFRNGVVLTGGGAQLHGLPEYLSQELKVNVEVSPDPVNCVALGTAMSLGLNDKLETGFMDATPRIGRR